MSDERIEPLTPNTTGTPVQNYDEVIDYLKNHDNPPEVIEIQEAWQELLNVIAEELKILIIADKLENVLSKIEKRMHKMSIFKRGNFNFNYTPYYKRDTKGEDIPLYIGNDIQIESIFSDDTIVELRLSASKPKPIEKPEGYFYRNPFGYETIVEFKGVEIESNLLRDTILVKGSIEPTYQERQAEIEDLMEKIENSPNCKAKKVTHIWGKPICEYSQNELLEHLTRIWGITQ